MVNEFGSSFRIKGQTASKYGLPSQPRLVDIIAAVPSAYRKVRISSFFMGRDQGEGTVKVRTKFVVHLVRLRKGEGNKSY